MLELEDRHIFEFTHVEKVFCYVKIKDRLWF